MGNNKEEFLNLSEEVQNKYLEQIIQTLGDAMECTRVWSAWEYGTMSQGDFFTIAEYDDEVLDRAVKLYVFTKEIIGDRDD